MSKQTIHRGSPDQQQQQQPPIQPSPSITSAGMESLAYSLDSSQPDSPTGPYDIKRIHGMAPPHDDDDGGGEYSIYSEEMSRMSAYNQYQEQADGQQHHQLPTVNEYQMNNAVEEVEFDATATVHEMHRKLLHLLSHPELFTEALVWESKLERGLDPSRPDEEEDDVVGGGGGDGGIKSFENEFGGADEQKDEETDDDGEAKGNHRQTLLPPLPLQIFAADAEVVLPQALTATQLFGMERVTGIELEAAAGITGLSHLFQRWLALMPEGDHMNIIRPPGLTVMRISGGRYRVTAAHRVVWRWMNKFSFSDAMFQGPSDLTDTAAPGDEEGSNDTDFDFGDLVTMTIIDVFETDVDGRLLSYCPTFDNRAVHKTQETVERIKKGATQFKERIEVVKKSPAGQSAQHVAEDLGKRGLSAAFKGFTLVKNRIETEIHNRQHPRTEEKPNVAASTASSDAVGGEDIGDEASEK
mmetsp:Transcript_9144/g.15546  ORF Transcript_9144/g.15546 Transcript_9144/m.15546 type:complete len:469 (-) Transcript_9144:180-1586(-)